MENTFNFFTALKLVWIKNDIVYRKAVLNSKKNYVHSQFTQFQFIGEKIIGNFENHYKKINRFKNLRIPIKDGGSRSSIVNFPKGGGISNENTSLSFLKENVDKIEKAFKGFCTKNVQPNNGVMGKGISLKIAKCDVAGNIVN